MQSPEFNKMMEGQQAKWADLSGLTGKEIKDVLFNKNVPVEEKREEIAKQEVPIPIEIRNQIDKFIADHQKLGTKNRTIRRMVKRKFNIVVV